MFEFIVFTGIISFLMLRKIILLKKKIRSFEMYEINMHKKNMANAELYDRVDHFKRKYNESVDLIVRFEGVTQKLVNENKKLTEDLTFYKNACNIQKKYIQNITKSNIELENNTKNIDNLFCKVFVYSKIPFVKINLN